MIRRASLGVAMVAALAGAAPAAAADITVTTTADSVAADGRCSLREAITKANTDAPTTVPGECAPGSGPDVVHVPAGAYTLSRPGTVENDNLTGDLDVTAGAVELRGAGRERTTISADRLDRVIDVTAPGASLTVVGITLTDGAAPDGADSPLPGDGGSGGGIVTRGALTLQSSAVVGNAAGRGVYTPGPFDGGMGGFGGGIHVFFSGSLTVADSVIARNRAGSAAPSPAGEDGLRGGDGGGVYAVGPVTIRRSTVEGNVAGTGGRGGDGVTSPGRGGSGGQMGGIHAGTVLTLERSIVRGNSAGIGGRGGDATGPGAAGGNGGIGGTIGGIYAESLTFTDSLLLGNASGEGGAGGSGSVGGTGGDATGVTDLQAGTPARITGSTIARGILGPPGAGGPGGAPGGSSRAWAILINGAGELTLERSVVEGACNVAPTDGGRNLVTSASCLAATADPLVDDRGVPLAGSPAIDGGGACTGTDLAGTTRAQGAACDVGAYEVAAATATAAPEALAFAPLTVGRGPGTLGVRAANPGLPGLTTAVAVTGGPDFTLAGSTCGPLLAGGAACDVIVAFAPSAPGLRTGTLSVAGRTIALSGTGLAAAPPPAVRRCVVPKLKGKTVAAARKALTRANCKLGKVTRRGRGRPGRIRAFSPKAGSVRPAGATVRVTVNAARAPSRR